MPNLELTSHLIALPLVLRMYTFRHGTVTASVNLVWKWISLFNLWCANLPWMHGESRCCLPRGRGLYSTESSDAGYESRLTNTIPRPQTSPPYYLQDTSSNIDSVSLGGGQVKVPVSKIHVLLLDSRHSCMHAHTRAHTCTHSSANASL